MNNQEPTTLHEVGDKTEWKHYADAVEPLL